VLPVKRYKDMADRYGIILAGSNSSQNRQKGELTSKIVNAAIGDVKKRFNVDESKIFTSGFSGGARVAVLAALSGRYGIRGVIGCAAGFPNVQSLAGMNFTWVGVVGDRDFNYLELVNVNRQLEAAGFDSHLLVFDGKHDWPPVETFDDALNILFSGKALEFADTPESRKWEEAEMKQRQILADAMQSQSAEWWNKTTDAIVAKTKSSVPEQERLMNERLLSFLSIVSFMNARNALSRNKIENAKKYLSVYEKVDPQNPDVYFLKAEYYMLQKKPEQALAMLKRSAELGYSNYENITENSHFISLHTNPSFKKLADKVRQNIETE
jgi:hypothetical protein